jgi:predicted porin
MKKSGLIMTMLAASTTAAFAQSTPSNVTMYGIVDGGVMHLTGLANGSTTRMVSGIMDGSRFGIRGNEDLGGGYKAIFLLENRTEIDTGATYNTPFSGTQVPSRFTDPTFLGFTPATAPGTSLTVASRVLNASIGVNNPGSSADAPRFWDRQAYVGLITPVGAVLGGRQYTPAYEVNATYDIMNTQSALSAGQVASFPPAVDIRLSNTVQYRIQAAGVTASLMYGFGEAGDTSVKNRFYGGMAQYKNESVSFGVGYNSRNNEFGQSSLRTLTVGGLVNFGSNTVSAMYGKAKDDHPTGLQTFQAALQQQLTGIGSPTAAADAAGIASAYSSALRQDSHLFHIGYRTTFGPNTVYVATSYLNDDRPADADTLSYGAGYTYAFSKRTDVNAIVARFDNRHRGQTAPGQAGMIGGFTASEGTDSTSISMGVRHRF